MRAHSTDPEPSRLVTDWFWISHDEASGRPRVSRTHLGLGLGSTLLASLLLSGHVVVQADAVVPTTTSSPPGELAHQVFSQIAAEPRPLGVRTWLSYLSLTATGEVTGHLRRRGLVREQRSRLLRKTRFVPLDPVDAALPANRLRSLLISREARSLHDPLLVAITEATGLLESVVDPDEIRTAREAVPAVTGRLPDDLRVLVAHTRAASGAAVLAPRQ